MWRILANNSQLVKNMKCEQGSKTLKLSWMWSADRKSFARDNVWHTDALPSHFSMVKLHCLNFRIITAFLGCPFFYLNRLMTKTTKWLVRPAKSQISLGIHPVWSESSLCAQWVAKGPNFHHADSEDFDQTGWMPRLIWVFAGRTSHFVGFVMMRLILRYLEVFDSNTISSYIFLTNMPQSRGSSEVASRVVFEDISRKRVSAFQCIYPHTVAPLNSVYNIGLIPCSHAAVVIEGYEMCCCRVSVNVRENQHYLQWRIQSGFVGFARTPLWIKSIAFSWGILRKVA